MVNVKNSLRIFIFLFQVSPPDHGQIITEECVSFIFYLSLLGDTYWAHTFQLYFLNRTYRPHSTKR